MGLSWQQGPLAPTAWYTAQAGDRSQQRAAWRHTELPGYASELAGRVAFAWRAMDAFYEEDERIPAQGQTFCPYKGVCSYYDIQDARRAAWSYADAYTEVRRISGLISFEPDKVAVHLDGARLKPEPGQSVVPHGIDRDLTTDEVAMLAAGG